MAATPSPAGRIPLFDPAAPPIVLVANRGEIAVRILRSVASLGLGSLAVYSEHDRAAPHVALADRAVALEKRTVLRHGDDGAETATPIEPYLDADQLIAVALEHGVWGVHPGYGFLSESAEFAAAVEAAGLVFIGPSPEQIRMFGSKQRAREAAARAGVPMVRGTGLLRDAAQALTECEDLGYPVILKATGGGGGIGMEVVRRAEEVAGAFERVERLSRHGAGGAGLFAERYVQDARHVEVQLFGDGRGSVISLGDRDCSLQRRNQKVVEEAPAFELAPTLRAELHDSARRLAAAFDYRSAGTVEFIYDRERGEASFLEVNTRLQVEHGVTEAVTGVDLVEWMLRLALGDDAFLAPFRETAAVPVVGAAVEARVYAEDPSRGFQPSAGTITRALLPEDAARVDAWIASGTEVSSAYDPLLAKVITSGDDRVAAWGALAEALEGTRVDGIETNLGLLRAIAASGEVAAMAHSTATLNTLGDASPRIRVLRSGLMTTVQDWPGRTGLWHIGVPPSGPMDDLSFRLGNRALGNAEGAAGLECTMTGPALEFTAETVVCVTGAPIAVTVDGEPAPMWQPITVPAGGVLDLGPTTPAASPPVAGDGDASAALADGDASTATTTGGGLRSYLLIEGGLDVPLYLGSASTFTLGQFGGHAGRALIPTDVLRAVPRPTGAPAPAAVAVPRDARPVFAAHWELAVAEGPHGAPEFFLPEDIAELYATDYRVHFNSARTGVRLEGPRPRWARGDGGEAGLHPSNIHDTPYSVGALDFTGDTPILLGPDGPSLGGFVCPVTVISSERWKLGQLRPGDTVRFVPQPDIGGDTAEGGVLARREPTNGEVPVCYRRSGDDNLLVEYGPMVLDLALRARVHALHQRLLAEPIAGVRELTPGIRSLQLKFDPSVLSTAALLAALQAVEDELPATSELVVPSRRVRLPLSWDDPATREAIARYIAGVRDDAPWNPWNIEFIRRINGLDSVDEVFRTVFEAEYLVLGLGDVYLGAPVATPLDPRHRLVTTKYNPARTWTAENSVGIGGAYLCIYGMEGPGGYQFVGRTTQVWSRYGDFDGPLSGVVGEAAEDRRPWLLDFFDRISWYPVSPEELLELRAEMAAGRWRPEIEEGEFSLAEHEAFLAENAASIAAFRAGQGGAFQGERDRWQASGEFDRQDVEPAASEDAATLAEGEHGVEAPFVANVWKVLVEEGETVAEGQPVLVLEAMKMETTVTSPAAGTVSRILTASGRQVRPGEPLVAVAAG